MVATWLHLLSCYCTDHCWCSQDMRLVVVMFCNSGVQVRTATVASINIVLYTPVRNRICILYVIYFPWAEKQWFNWMMFL